MQKILLQLMIFSSAIKLEGISIGKLLHMCIRGWQCGQHKQSYYGRLGQRLTALVAQDSSVAV